MALARIPIFALFDPGRGHEVSLLVLPKLDLAELTDAVARRHRPKPLPIADPKASLCELIASAASALYATGASLTIDLPHLRIFGSLHKIAHPGIGVQTDLFASLLLKSVDHAVRERDKRALEFRAGFRGGGGIERKENQSSQ